METKLYIDGQWTEARSGARFAVRNPSTGTALAQVADGGTLDTRDAIEAAARAFPSWAATVARARGSLLEKAWRMLLEQKEEIARILTQEEGKPLAEARGEIDYAADFLWWYAHEAPRLVGEVVAPNAAGKRQTVLRQPLGVVGAITPWNFPAAMVTRKIAPAVAAGCTVVFKPAEATPLTAVRLFQIFHDAGFPPGVLNLVTSNRAAEVGGELMSNATVRKVSFTGSTNVGKQLMRQAADGVKKLSLELGGHAPVIVFDDADLDRAADGAVYTKFRNMGQTCISLNRLLVQESILEPFLEKYVARVKALKVGDGLAADVQVGPLINGAAHQKVTDHVADAVARGAQVLCGGAAATGAGLEAGAFYQPTVLAGVTPAMKIFREETFGPVAPVITFRTEAEGLAMANDSIYGLAAYAFTRDVGRAARVSEGLDYGIVGINDPAPTGAHAPFGGVKQSGMGREGGHFGLEEFTFVKFVSVGL